MDENKPSTDTLDSSIGEESNEGENVSASSDTLTLEDINAITKREFKSKEEFEKHYQNLNSMVGTGLHKQEEHKPAQKEHKPAQNDELRSEFEQFKTQVTETEFLRSNPEATAQMDLVRSLSKTEGITLEEAWNSKVKELVTNSIAYQRETGIGVKPSNKQLPTRSKEFAETIKKVTENPQDERSRLDLIKNSGLM